VQHLKRNRRTQRILPLLIFLLPLLLAPLTACESQPDKAPPSTPSQPSEPPPQAPAESLADQAPTVELMRGEQSITIRATAPFRLDTVVQGPELPSGTWNFTLTQAAPPRQRYRYFVESFNAREESEAIQCVRDWAARGYPAEIITLGKRLRTDNGGIVDSRVFWVSLGSFEQKARADALKKHLEQEKQWGWVQAETVAPGAGIAAASADGRSLNVPVPFRLRSSAPIEVKDVNYGFWDERREDRIYAWPLEFAIDSGGKLAIFERVPVEEYVAGILPAEMPALWPAEALKAQAVAARSELLVKLGVTHALQGFDFCGNEHCRAYRGHGGRHPGTDAAAAATAGEVLTVNGGILATVFSATCGGYTENNENVWAAPPNPALRGIGDYDPPPPPPAQTGLSAWLLGKPPAFCASDTKYYRWRRSYTTGELSAIVNKRHNVGKIRAIELGERGVSGRLKWVRITGSERTETVHKELAIRFAFGGLPSGMFIIDTEPGPNDPARFTFIGGGRGHGVGMCQYGAKGMAVKGLDYQSILLHYFSGAKLERLSE